jgi:CheY-like chemotaxis protein
MAGPPILVVDDDGATREALETRLRADGYAAISASDGREALARLGEVNPCLILLDYAMPVMNGLAFREAQKADARWSAIPVVLITGNDPPASAIGAMAPVAVLHKPIEYEALAPLLERACRHEARAAATS